MKLRTGILIGTALAGLGGAAGYFIFHHQASPPSWRLAAVERGAVVQTVRATGIVQPLRAVEVGTQVNGPVQKLYVDFNDHVRAGDLVAQIDPTVYQARLAQDEANLASSLANVEQTRAKLVQAEKELARSRTLAGREMLSQSELDGAVAARDALAAQLKVTEATVAQARAALRLSTANLGYTTIRSPVEGVVVARNVDEGQTVVASMTAQILFRIATDLKDIQVEASVPEADIGSVRPGQPVTFTVDAYDESFTGTVAQVRLAATTVQNVVTYPVIVSAPNPDRKLFPGMTANIACEVARRENVLRVPNAALRFKPPAPADGARNGADAGAARGRPGARVWGLDADRQQPRALTVTAGITDGAHTELRDPGPLTEGQSVIVGMTNNSASAQADQPVNPFAPRFPGAARRAAR